MPDQSEAHIDTIPNGHVFVASPPIAFTNTCAKCGELVADGRTVHLACETETVDAKPRRCEGLKHMNTAGMDDDECADFCDLYEASEIRDPCPRGTCGEAQPRT